MDWLNPLNKLTIAQAVRARRSVAHIKIDGKTFRLALTYGNPARAGQVHFKPLNESMLVPCGYFNIEKVTDDNWLES